MKGEGGGDRVCGFMFFMMEFIKKGGGNVYYWEILTKE